MRDRARLKHLAALAEMQKKHDMARLKKLAQRREQTRQKVAELSKPLALAEDPALFVARQRHAQWAQQQRLRLNHALALQTADMLEQRRKSAKSLGRADVLARLLRR
ncbi:MAG: hypothetical protein JJT99_08045 [Rhodobacteraceae bacterium]|nr:hypothetical protein [Paracoccaceae bacterium]